MATEKTEDKKPLRLTRPGKLELKKTVEGGQVRQSFSHGRTKTVAVEVKRSRTYERGDKGGLTKVRDTEQTEQERALALATKAVKRRHDTEEAPPEETKSQPGHLTESERQARARALEHAREMAESRGHGDQADTADGSTDEAGPDTPSGADAQIPPEASPDDGTDGAGADLAGPADAAADATQVGLRFVSRAEPVPAAPAVEDDDDDEGARRRRAAKADPRRAPAARRGEPRRRAGKLTIGQALGNDLDDERMRSLASVRRARQKEKARAQRASEGPHQIVRDVVVPETITVQELANRMAARGADVIKALMKMGVMATITQTIDADMAELIVSEFGHNIKRVSEADVEIGLKGDVDTAGDLVPRAPVVTVMGHVDHGKTSLLDALRSADVAAHEAGGITQHIGAYRVQAPSGRTITFIDTPGHAAFSAMRARGANVTDIVILVVAADDGIKEQTIEAIKHAKAANAPIVVAVNKIDKEGADPKRVRQELLTHEIVAEEFGGDVQVIDVSAIKKTGLDKLEEAILLQADIMDLKANPDRSAEGIVIEAKLERGRGSVATVLVQRGTLRVGDIVIAGAEWGRVRALIDDRGAQIKEAGPSVPVEILGLNGLPGAGDDFAVVENESRAREITDYRHRQRRNVNAAATGRGTLEQQFARIAGGETSEVPVIVKADVQGSAEAIRSSLEQIGNTEVAARVLLAGVGAITESDINLAISTNAMIIGFNVRANPQARDLAKANNVDIRYYSIIYDVINDMKAVLSGKLAPTVQETFIGNARILEVFDITKTGKVAGCRVTDGVVRRDHRVRLLRDDVVIHEGKLSSLRRFKDEVREVKSDVECGIALENFQDMKVGDVIECYETVEVSRQL